MKILIKNLSVFLSLLALVTITSCSSDTTVTPAPATPATPATSTNELISLAIAVKKGQKASALAGTTKTIDLTTIYTVTPTPSTANSEVTWSFIGGNYSSSPIQISGNTLTILDRSTVGYVNIRATSITHNLSKDTRFYLTGSVPTALAISLRLGEATAPVGEATAPVGIAKSVDLGGSYLNSYSSSYGLYTITPTPTTADARVTWTVEPAYPGVRIVSGDRLTISSTAAVGTFTLKATTITAGSTVNATTEYIIK